jgi:hypothetical protein
MHKAYAARLSIMRATILLSMVAFLFGVLAVPAQRAFGMDIREWVVKKETKGDDDDDMTGGYKLTEFSLSNTPSTASTDILPSGITQCPPSDDGETGIGISVPFPRITYLAKTWILTVFGE